MRRVLQILQRKYKIIIVEWKELRWYLQKYSPSFSTYAEVKKSLSPSLKGKGKHVSSSVMKRNVSFWIWTSLLWRKSAFFKCMYCIHCKNTYVVKLYVTINVLSSIRLLLVCFLLCSSNLDLAVYLKRKQ